MQSIITGRRGAMCRAAARPGHRSLAGILVAATLAVMLALVLGARSANAETRELRVEVSEGELITLPQAASTIFVAEPAIADIQTPSRTRVFVFGKAPGRTTLFALDDTGNTIAEYHITVAYTDEQLQALLAAEVGDVTVSLTYTPNGAVLTGTVPTPEIAERVRSAASTYVGSGVVLINQLRVGGALEVTLHVRIAEISRAVSQEIGINWNAVGSVGNFAFGLANGRNVVGPTGGAQRSATGAGSLFGSFQSNSVDFTGIIDALADEGLVSILAEPTLTALSGESASFLAGGEFPIPVAQGDNTISVEFRQFGVSLEFVPTVLNNDLVAIHVKPEVSELSTQGAVILDGISIPAVTERRAETTIELGSGQSFAIAGLIRGTSSANLRKFPGLGDLPVLGSLFRSTEFQQEETELVIIVTPYIVRPAQRPSALQDPVARVSPISEVERILEEEHAIRPGSAGDDEGPLHLQGDFGFIVE